VTERQVLVDTKLDFMVPARLESEAWIMPQSYLDLYSRRTITAMGDEAASQQAAAEYLLVSGLINLDGSASFEYFYRQVQTDPLENPPVGTAYCLELHDAEDATLAGYCFDISFGFGDGTTPMTAAPFALSVPFAPTTKQIVLKHGGTTVATRTVSNNAPTVSVSMPGGGVVKTLSWAAADVDGDALSYSVLYSANNKASWYAVATDVTQTVYSLDTSLLPGGTQCYVRILATDGVNTGEGDAGPFIVMGKEPTALINAPADGAAYAPGENVLFEGDGVDLEDGSLADSALTWSSDRDGTLGTGRTLELNNLSAGQHVITLMVMDSTGYTASAHITLYIREPVQALYLPLLLKRR
jgi:hypothetical protein